MSKQDPHRWLDLRGDETGDRVGDVVARELALLRPEVRAEGVTVTALLHEEFREFGSSGRVWDRGEVVEALAAEPGDDAPGVDGLRAAQLGDDVVLLTYRASRSDRVTLRSSLWVRSVGGWQLLFHQGTVCP